MKHTKGPLEVHEHSTGEVQISSGKSPDPVTRSRYTFVATMTDFSKGDPMWEWPTRDEQLDLADRIVACVNACDAAGVEDPGKLGEFLESARGLLNWLETFRDCPPTISQIDRSREMFAAALDRVTNGGDA